MSKITATPLTDAYLSRNPGGFGMAVFCRRLELELAEIRLHADAMAGAIKFGDLAILTVAKAAAEAYEEYKTGAAERREILQRLTDMKGPS